MHCCAPGFGRSVAGIETLRRRRLDGGTVSVRLNSLPLQFLLHSQKQSLPEQFEQLAKLWSGQPAAQPGGTLHCERPPVVFEELIDDPTAHEFQLLFSSSFRGHRMKELSSLQNAFQQSSLFTAECRRGGSEDSPGR